MGKQAFALPSGRRSKGDRPKRTGPKNLDLAEIVLRVAEQAASARRGTYGLMDFLVELIVSQPRQFFRLAAEIVKYKSKNLRRCERTGRNTNELTLAEAILRAADLAGSNGRGKDGRRGYFFRILNSHPRLFIRLMGDIAGYEHMMAQDRRAAKTP